jgi:hypothetical protein
MRLLLLSILGVLVTALPLPAQNPSASPFLLKFKYIEGKPAHYSGMCIAVSADGKFHMEEKRDAERYKAEVFEDSIPEENLKQLSAILATPALKELKAPTEGPYIILAEGELAWAVIPRAEATQSVGFPAWQESGNRAARPFPNSFLPLVQWVLEANRTVHQQKLQPLHHVKTVDCWMRK